MFRNEVSAHALKKTLLFLLLNERPLKGKKLIPMLSH
jgi:hypothetical protein